MSTREWDFEWHYTDGTTPAQVGWTKTTIGTPIESMQSDGLLLRGCYYNKEQQILNGVMEAKFSLQNGDLSKNRARIHLRIGSSASDCLYVECRSYTSGNTKRIDIVDNSVVASRTIIGSWTAMTDIVLRLTIRNGIGTVEKDGSVLRTNIDTRTMHDGGLLRCGNMTDVEGNVGCILKYIKYKLL